MQPYDKGETKLFVSAVWDVRHRAECGALTGEGRAVVIWSQGPGSKHGYDRWVNWVQVARMELLLMSQGQY